MPKTSHHLTTEEKELLVKLAQKYEVSQSKILGMSLGKYAEILEEDGQFSEELKSISRKATLSRQLKELRNEGKLLSRDIAYASANKRRALKAIDESDMTDEEKEYWRRVIEEQAKKRREIAEELLVNPGDKEYIPPKEGSKEWYIQQIQRAGEKERKRKKWIEFNDMLVKKYIYQGKKIPKKLDERLQRLRDEAFPEDF